MHVFIITSCDLTFPACNSRFPENMGRTATRRTIDRTFARWFWRWCSTARGARSARICCPATRPTRRFCCSLPRQTCRRPAPRRIRQTERNEARPGNRRLTLLVALVPSVPEIRTRLVRLVFKTPNRLPDIIQWSLWRRKHQASAAVSHYKRRQNPQL